MAIQTLIGITNILAISLLLYVVVWSKNRTLSTIFICGLLIRIAISVLQEKYHLFPYDWDEATFYSAAQKVYDYFTGIRVEYPFDRIYSVSSYGSLLGSIFYFFGSSSIIARLLNALFGSIIILTTYRLSMIVGLENRRALFVSAIIAFTPSYIIYSSLIMRDMIVWILLFMIVIKWTKYINGENTIDFIFGVMFSLILIPFRKQYAPILVICAMAVVIVIFLRKRVCYQNVQINLIKYTFILSIILITGVLSFLLLKFEISSWGDDSIIEYLGSQLGWRIQGGTAYMTSVEYSSLIDIIKYLPLRFIHFTFGPFLWTSSSYLVILSAMETLIGTVFFIIILFNTKNIFQKIDFRFYSTIFILMFALLGLLSNAIIDSNYGTAMRHRMVFMPFIFIIACHIVTIIVPNGNKYVSD
ncbi:MAG: hypothetical protein ISR90_03585 [Candidatus Marinimicrobia bacterium]|nr:hypothetical protein [Candidatus Neomarinimicrobiota bacterium]